MALKLNKMTGEPVFTFRFDGHNYTMAFINPSRERVDKWDRILISGGPTDRLKSNPQTTATLNLKGLPQKMMSLKSRHKLLKILKKYTRTGFFRREDIGALYKDLAMTESKFIERVDRLLE
jgi:hypothetical protein